MSTLSIAWKDLQILLKDRSNLISTFLVPVAFVIVYLGVAGAGGGAEEKDAQETNRISVPVVNLDQGGKMADLLLDTLNEDGGLLSKSFPQDEAAIKLEDGDFEFVLTIPAGFTADLDAGESVELVLEYNTLDREKRESVTLAVEGVARDMSLEHQIIATLQQMAQMQAANPNAADVASPDLAVPIAREQFVQSRDRPLIAIEDKAPGDDEEKDNIELSTQIAIPGFSVLFVFLTAQVTARSIYDEKKTGTFRRLLAAPLGNIQVLLGKMVPNFIIVILQMVFLFLTAIYILPLLGLERLSLGNDLFALILLVITVALCSTTLGVLIAAIARTEAQIGGISAVVLWVLAFLGGTFIPLFLVNETMANLGKVTPHYWAVTGFYDLLTRGHGLSSITDSLLILTGFTILFFLVGVWRFDFE